MVHFCSIREGEAAVLLKSSLSPSNKEVAFRCQAGILNEQCGLGEMNTLPSREAAVLQAQPTRASQECGSRFPNLLIL